MKIILSDGTVIDNLTANANEFVSETEITPDIFTNNLSPVKIIDDDGNETIYENGNLDGVIKTGDLYYIAIRELSDYELKEMQTRADIDYLLMMVD